MLIFILLFFNLKNNFLWSFLEVPIRFCSSLHLTFFQVFQLLTFRPCVLEDSSTFFLRYYFLHVGSCSLTFRELLPRVRVGFPVLGRDGSHTPLTMLTRVSAQVLGARVAGRSFLCGSLPWPLHILLGHIFVSILLFHLLQILSSHLGIV